MTVGSTCPNSGLEIMSSVSFRLSTSLTALLAITVSLGLLNHWRNGISWIGFGAIFTTLASALLLLMALLAFRVSIRRQLCPALFLGSLVVAMYVYSVLVNRVDIRGIMVIGELVGALSLFVFVSLLPWDEGRIFVFAAIVGFVILLVACLESFMPINKNPLGAMIGFLLYWPIAGYIGSRRAVSKLVWLAIILIGIVTVVRVGARSMWIALGAAFLVYHGFRIIASRRGLYSITFFVVLALIFAGMVVYTTLPYTELGLALQDFVQEKTQRNLFSGRDKLWPPLVTAILERPWFGYGASATPGVVMETTLSSHNLYLQIALQTGLLGVVVFVGFLFAVWRIYWLGRDNSLSRLSAAFLVAILVHQTFEVSLTQNHLAVGVTQWLTLGVGVGAALRSSPCNAIGRTRAVAR